MHRRVAHSTWLIVFQYVAILSVHGVKFEENCNKTVHCDAAAWLTCADASSTCQCAEAETMAYDKFKSKCVSKVGEKCHPILDDASIVVGSSSPECGVNAHCGVNLTCICNDGYYVSSSGFCVGHKTFAENCTTNDECKYEGAFLACINGKCGCNLTTQIYMTHKNRHVSGEEEIEVDGRHLGRNAYKVKGQADRTILGQWLRGDEDRAKGFILYTFENRLITEPLEQCVGLASQNCNPHSNCVENSKCVTGYCVCDADFTQKADGRCGRHINRECSNQIPCADTLACVEGHCQCSENEDQWYSAVLKKCLNRLHSFCSNDSECKEQMICILNPKSGRKQCSRISEGNACNPGRSAECDRGLVCKNGICSCWSTMKAYNSKIRKCVGRVGTPCGSLNVRYIPGLCVENAACEQPIPEDFGQCYCKMGFNFTRDGFCMKIDI